MKNGYARFAFYLDQIEGLMQTASRQADPAAWAYTNNVRTPIFMAEGLAKLCAGLHDKETFVKIGTRFKAVEDALGAIDYYDCFAKDFAADNKIPPSVAIYARAKADESTARLNVLLREEKWIGGKSSRLPKIRKKLGQVDWMKPRHEIEAIRGFYSRSIAQIEAFFASCGGRFTNVENQVHELRRKLRWLSIYPQALRGCIQMQPTLAADPVLAKYLTPAIVTSPFNKFPDPGTNRHLLLVDRDHFLALSWLIAELGRLKDAGLRTALIAEAKAATHDLKVSKSAIRNPRSEINSSILSEAYAICNGFFSEKILSGLLISPRNK